MARPPRARIWSSASRDKASEISTPKGMKGSGTFLPDPQPTSKHAARRKQALQPSGDAGRVDAGAPASHAVEPHTDGASGFPPLDLGHACFLPGEIAAEMF